MTQTLFETAATPASRADLQRLVDRGRKLQAEAVRDASRRFFRFLVSGCSLRVMRLAGPLPGQRQSCC